MGEINTETRNRKKGTKSKKNSTRVDLTPMVDLGFLLITFFIFTTSLSKPTAMKLVLPADGTGSVTSESKTLNIVLAGHNKIFYYKGNALDHFQETNYTAAGIRVVIQNLQRAVQASFGNAEEAVVLVKPTNDASYQNIVDVLDEMQINNLKRYCLMDVNKSELSTIGIVN